MTTENSVKTVLFSTRLELSESANLNKIDLFGLYILSPNTDHVIILRRLGPLFCSLKRVHVGIFMLACPHFNEQNKRPNLLSIIT